MGSEKQDLRREGKEPFEASSHDPSEKRRILPREGASSGAERGWEPLSLTRPGMGKSPRLGAPRAAAALAHSRAAGAPLPVPPCLLSARAHPFSPPPILATRLTWSHGRLPPPLLLAREARAPACLGSTTHHRLALRGCCCARACLCGQTLPPCPLPAPQMRQAPHGPGRRRRKGFSTCKAQGWN